MKNRSLKNIFVLSLSLISLVLIGSFYAPKALAVDPGEPIPAYRDVDLLVPIPIIGTSNLDDQDYVPSSSGGYLLSYMSIIITWLSGILGMVCVGIFIVSGFQIMANFGNTEAVTQAKDRILSAVFGLILLVTGALLLHTINPGYFRWNEEDENPGSKVYQISISVSYGVKATEIGAGMNELQDLYTTEYDKQKEKYSDTSKYLTWRCFPARPSFSVTDEGGDDRKITFSQYCRVFEKAKETV